MPSPSTRLPIAIVGLSFGKAVLTYLQKTPANQFFELAGVCDLRPNVAAEVSAQYGVKNYSSLEEVIQDPAIAVVGLFTGPQGRARLIDQILEAGKDILTTKPFELDADEAKRVLRKAQKLGRIIYTNSPSPKSTLDITQIEEWRDEFDLGRLISARGEVWASYFEKADGSWMDDPAACPGGVMMRLGIYLINDILRLSGSVVDIQFTGARIRTGRPTADNALLTLQLGGGAIATVFASFCVDDGDVYANGLTLNYERGTIYRNIGEHRANSKKISSNLSLIMRGADGRKVVAEAAFEEISGDYQWAVLHRAITQREPLSDSYIECVVKGIKVLQFLRDAAKPAPSLETNFVSPMECSDSMA
jgi:predicted dehydrogenase